MNKTHFIRQRNAEPGRKILPPLFHLLGAKPVAGEGCSGLQCGSEWAGVGTRVKFEGWRVNRGFYGDLLVRFSQNIK